MRLIILEQKIKLATSKNPLKEECDLLFQNKISAGIWLNI